MKRGVIAATALVLLILPLLLPAFRVGQVTKWIPLALAAMGLNLLTGYNGQISVGHGALYGLGAYATALTVTEWGVPYLVAIVLSAVVCFFAGVLVGLPALRIKGLYLALVTLAVATLFPQVIEQFSSVTGGSSGLSVTSEQMVRGKLRPSPIRFDPPEWTGLAKDQWKYYWFLAVAAVCVVVVANLVRSRVGRSMIAIRDNEIAAEVNGVNVSAVKVFTFGVSAALAGIGGALLALSDAFVSSLSFTVTISLYFLVAVVVGGAASISGPLIGAVFYGIFIDIVTPTLPESIEKATPLILGAVLIVLMLVAPGGIVGLFNKLMTKRRHRLSTDSGSATQ